MARVVKLNEGQLRRLVRRMLNEGSIDEGYKLYILPKRDADLDEIVEYIGAHRQESGMRWPALLNGGNRLDDLSDPHYGYYAIGFVDHDGNSAEEIATDFRSKIEDNIVQMEAPYKRVVSLLATLALQRGLKTQSDVSNHLNDILILAKSKTTGLGSKLEEALEVLQMDKNNLIHLISKNIHDRNLVVAPTTGSSRQTAAGRNDYVPIGWDNRDPRSSM